MFTPISSALIITLSLIVTLVYSNAENELMDVSSDPIYDYKGTEDFLINTTGCYIPNYGKTLVFEESRLYTTNCGERAISIERIENNMVIRIDNNIMEKYSKWKDIICCYRFGSRSKIPGKEDTQLSYTDCKSFGNGAKITLDEEIITVTCVSPPDKSNITQIIYEDAYFFVKKKPTETQTINKGWNVLMLGMDTMSRARLLSSMPDTVEYLHSHDWLDYKGYQKVGYNTFPNLIAVLTGKKLSTIYKTCKPSMTECNDHMIWSRFRRTGYTTAYVEENLSLPDTFGKKGFRTPPTEHYARPFFLTGETIKGNLVCAKHKPSAIHLLEYASEFANIYKNDKFFGFFWINSYSHNLNNVPTLLDKDIVNFFEELKNNNVMNNTFIIFLSDHGIRLGHMRVPMESYYEERLPMFFIWVPHEFRKLHADKYYNLKLNQNRLVTPYDLYTTLNEISNSSEESEACPQCTSLFDTKSADRTCAIAEVNEKWCSCHVMTKADNSDIGAIKSLQLSVEYIQNRSSSIKTTDCTACHTLRLDSVLRSYTYKHNDKPHYVVAFQMSPGNITFETTIFKDGNNYTILPPTDAISTYNSRGYCVRNGNDRPYCVCKNICTTKTS